MLDPASAANAEIYALSITFDPRSCAVRCSLFSDAAFQIKLDHYSIDVLFWSLRKSIVADGSERLATHALEISRPGQIHRIAARYGSISRYTSSVTIARISRFSKTRSPRSSRPRTAASTMARAKSSPRITRFGNSSRKTG